MRFWLYVCIFTFHVFAINNSPNSPVSFVSALFDKIEDVNRPKKLPTRKLNSARGPNTSCFPRLDVFRVGDKLFVQKTVRENVARCLRLSVHQDILNVSEIEDFPECFSTENIATVEALFGIYRLPSGYYAAFIESSIPAEGYGDEKIRLISSFRFERINTGMQSAEEVMTDDVRKVKETLLRHTLYYSYGEFDITRGIQANAMRESAKTWQDCDDHFFWNLNILTDVIEAQCHKEWIVPVSNIWMVFGDLMTVNNVKYTLSIVSRRSRRRQGPRYIKRGSNLCGDVANFVETEQILRSSNGGISSFLQVSI